MTKKAKQLYSLVITPDPEGEKFTESKCKCEKCLSMHASNNEWDTFEAKTFLQKNMKKKISELEKRYS